MTHGQKNIKSNMPVFCYIKYFFEQLAIAILFLAPPQHKNYK